MLHVGVNESMFLTHSQCVIHLFLNHGSYLQAIPGLERLECRQASTPIVCKQVTLQQMNFRMRQPVTAPRDVVLQK